MMHFAGIGMNGASYGRSRVIISRVIDLIKIRCKISLRIKIYPAESRMGGMYEKICNFVSFRTVHF
jgi:hypothetical protein